MTDALVAWAREHVPVPVDSVEVPHVRPWSTLARLDTRDGPFWAKANGSGTAYEPALTALLASLRTGLVPEPLAIDADRGFGLYADEGVTLRSLLDAAPDLGWWERILPAYAALQRASEPLAGAMLAAGVPDQRPEALPGALRAMLAQPEWYREGDPDGIDPDDLARVRAAVPAYERECAELAASGIAPAVQHDDLHDGNVLVRDGVARVADWGDAALAHPFGTMVVVLRAIPYRFGAAADEAAMARLRATYLDVWSDLHDPGTLADVLRLAVRVSVLGRALAWQRAFNGVPPRSGEPWADGPPGWLAEVATDR